MTDFDFSSHKLDKKTFYSYCLFIQRERRYKSNWAFVMVKSCVGEWVEKSLKAETQNPSRETDPRILHLA